MSLDYGTFSDKVFLITIDNLQPLGVEIKLSIVKRIPGICIKDIHTYRLPVKSGLYKFHFNGKRKSLIKT